MHMQTSLHMTFDDTFEKSGRRGGAGYVRVLRCVEEGVVKGSQGNRAGKRGLQGKRTDAGGGRDGGR